MKSLLPATLLILCMPAAAQPKIDGAALLEQIATLASDEFEGRAPGTRGEVMTIDYLQQQFKKLGLEPGNPDGSYLQAVPLVGISSHPTLSYGKDDKLTQLKFGDDYIAWTARADKQLELAGSELVFVGYGVQAPEYKWDDYKGADLKGKTLVMLINDPPVPDPKRPKLLDAKVFGGNTVTWYGRWNYKLEIAARLGAAGALIVHDTKAAGYPYEVVVNSWGRENFALRNKQPEPYLPAVAGWLQQERACDLFKAAGMDFKELKQRALSRDFKPVPLGIKLNLAMVNATRELSSHNVVARIPGSDPKLKDEVVVYTAHWDHFGIDETLPGPRTQQIFHGAVDNASGVAALLQIARAYKALPVAPKRSIVFVATTAQERGLLGAQYYVRHPLYPISKTVLNLNIDGMNLWGRTRDIELSGMGKSTADELVKAIAAKQGRAVRADSNISYGSYYRGDQLEFARAGVPTVYLRSSAGKQLYYTAHQFHTVHDTVQPNWNTTGAIDDIQLLYQAGYQAAQAKDQPKWHPDAEFQRH
ncbi:MULTISPECIES: M28 family peptidase [unclassified Duganella]|uniref:M28 family peptidase n=1 Tax=unclassified Duganella TaxID=2636909 RepID=UPI000886C089|nr:MULTISPECIES: M28 family peptidase [unclassified Duganella]SDH49893.1 Zn-dependent amino-or carboxypeptidase, M28 family [Duganella sp. OV458]SDK63494.1 Zn-dependent amino-or carboxypeptidase, M28 family [Duganella sp. OV510]